MSHGTFLVIGCGNPGRGDDGLGPALVERLAALGLPGVTTDADYQLSIGHAALAAAHDVVVFADAASDAETAYYLRPVQAATSDAFTSHAMTPGQVLLLARRCFGAAPLGFALGMRAPSLERFEESLSPAARSGLEAALDCLVRIIAGPPGRSGAGATVGMERADA
jgi:hydrogenase maturation protease